MSIILFVRAFIKTGPSKTKTNALTFFLHIHISTCKIICRSLSSRVLLPKTEFKLNLDGFIYIYFQVYMPITLFPCDSNKAGLEQEELNKFVFVFYYNIMISFCASFQQQTIRMEQSPVCT